MINNSLKTDNGKMPTPSPDWEKGGFINKLLFPENSEKRKDGNDYERTSMDIKRPSMEITSLDPDVTFIPENHLFKPILDENSKFLNLLNSRC